jgi:hypothetical protein
MGKRHGQPTGMDIGINVSFFPPSPLLLGLIRRQAQTITDLHIPSLGINIYDGKALEPAYTPHPFKGPEPVAEIENAKLYTGSCHCGNVTLAMKTKGPLTEGHKHIQGCNCSICSRVSLPLFSFFLSFSLSAN